MDSGQAGNGEIESQEPIIHVEISTSIGLRPLARNTFFEIPMQAIDRTESERLFRFQSRKLISASTYVLTQST